MTREKDLIFVAMLQRLEKVGFGLMPRKKQKVENEKAKKLVLKRLKSFKLAISAAKIIICLGSIIQKNHERKCQML